MNFENLDEESITLLKDIIRERFESLIRNPVLVHMLLSRPDLLNKYQPLFPDILLEKNIANLEDFLKSLPWKEISGRSPPLFSTSVFFV